MCDSMKESFKDTAGERKKLNEKRKTKSTIKVMAGEIVKIAWF